MMVKPTLTARDLKRLPLYLALGLTAGCMSMPYGPSVMALPGNGASFDQFRVDDANCQLYARHASGVASPSPTAEHNAVVATVIGAAAGALLGAASGNAGAGAAIGAGGGLLLGSASGADTYAAAGYSQQEQLDNAYVQCMYGHGHQVPVPASVAAAQQQQAMSPPPSAAPAPGPGPGGGYPPPGTAPPRGY